MDGGWDSARGKREGGGCGAPGDAETLCNRGGSGGVAMAEAEAGAVEDIVQKLPTSSFFD